MHNLGKSQYSVTFSYYKWLVEHRAVWSFFEGDSFPWLTPAALRWAAEAVQWSKWPKTSALDANQEDCLQILGQESACKELATKTAGKEPPLSAGWENLTAAGPDLLPEINWASDLEADFPEVDKGDCPGFQNWLEVSECCHRRASGS